jgi:hypothetical protein
MSNGLRKLLRKAKDFLREKRQKPSLPGRVFVRAQGCWNCSGFDQGPLFEQQKVATGMRDVRVLVSQGRTPDEAASAIGSRQRLLLAHGAGLCLRGGSKGDFVSAKYLCDKWQGRVAVDRFGGGIDPLPEELKEQLGDPKPGEATPEDAPGFTHIIPAKTGEA